MKYFQNHWVPEKERLSIVDIGSSVFSRILFPVVLFITCGCSHQNTDWPHYLGGSDRNHYSKLDQINKENVHLLEVAWTYHTGDFGEMQCNPLIIDGVLISTTATNEVVALDARSGQLLWKFIPTKNKSFLVNRGVSYWNEGSDRRIYTTYGEWLYALDFQTGKPVASFGDLGKTHLKAGLGASAVDKFVTSRTPGTVFKDLIIMPLVVSEGSGAAPGFVQAFNVKTGALEWVFNTIPQPGEFGYETWPEDAYRNGIIGGANNWSGMSLDPIEEIIYVPTGSASPDFYGGDRLGQNLFANSVIALNANTGERIWHFQAVHHDIWDRDLPAPPNLMTLEIKGNEVKALAQVTKSGYVFVLDRLTGVPLFPVDEVPVPASVIPGEEAWPTQPVPRLPVPFSRLSITEEEINPYSPDRDSLLLLFQHAHKELFTPLSEEPTFILPGSHGGAEWGGAAVDPEGILYINSNEMAVVFSLSPIVDSPKANEKFIGETIYNNHCASCHRPDRSGIPDSGYPSLIGVKNRLDKENATTIIRNGKGRMTGFPQFSDAEMEHLLQFLYEEAESIPTVAFTNSQAQEKPRWRFNGYTRFKDSEGAPGISPPWGTLTAIDLNTGFHKWQIPLGESSRLKDLGIEGSGTPNYGGPLVTENGLLFIAATTDNKFRAFDKTTGETLWEALLPYAGFATPSTYQIDGKQYLVIVCGGTKADAEKGDAIVAFALPE